MGEHSRTPTRAHVPAGEAVPASLPRLSARTLALVGLGAAIGASQRYALGSSLLANTLGTALLACLLTALALTTVHPAAADSDSRLARSEQEPSTPRDEQQLVGREHSEHRDEQHRAGQQLSEQRRSDLRILLGAGLCGGLTTYSTIMLDAVTSTSLASAAQQLGLDFACGLGAAVLAIVVTRTVLRRRPLASATAAPSTPARASSPRPAPEADTSAAPEADTSAAPGTGTQP
ncbi:hypothetical protein BSZ39_10870 [Bowdeniella nasicola]|uniref:Fluoride-specific ion channel n=1 Tax=Bowdeniella nasicola TaxID=208480 RepID=A0A1Q5Q0C7_9ACTO|nr:hypothetical protein BSZ39_10870 [Bowdeniella nasicola]